jgi:hypothetical protein
VEGNEFLAQAFDGATRNWSSLALQMSYCQLVDGFERYLKDLLVTVYRLQPETLRSQQQVSVEEVLAHSSIEEFVHAYAVDRVEKISRAGIREYVKAFEALGVMAIFSEHLEKLKQSFDLRHAMVHRNVLADPVDFATVFRRHEKRFQELHGTLNGAQSFFTQLAYSVDLLVAGKFPSISVTETEWHEQYGPKTLHS